MVSIIIPSRNEKYLDKALEGYLVNFKGDFEIIVNIDGYDEPIKEVEGVTYIHNKESKGMRPAINEAVALAKGKYILKIDAHCLIDEGLDVKLTQDHQPNWVQTPRRYRMDHKTWSMVDDGRPPIDYMYLNADLVGVECRSKNRDPKLAKKLLDDTETFQGSCYFMEKDLFYKLGLMDVGEFGTFANEAQEIGIKCVGNGGRVVVNKNTWYAHPRAPRRYSLDLGEVDKARAAAKKIKEFYGYRTDREIQEETLS